MWELDLERKFLNKWEMNKLLDNQLNAPCSIPCTILYSSEIDVMNMLNRFNSIYIKPVDSWGGKNIHRIDYNPKAEISHAYTWTQQGKAGEMYSSLDELLDQLKTHIADNSFIVQQTAPIITFESTAFDIRVHMQKEADGSWVYAGDLVRVSGPDSIVSNVEISQGKVVTTQEVLGEKTLEIKEDLKKVGYSICTLLDVVYDFNEVGLDLGVDDEGHLWLMEVNTNDVIGAPCHALFAQLPDKTMYDQIRRRGLERAKVPEWLIQLLFNDDNDNHFVPF